MSPRPARLAPSLPSAERASAPFLSALVPSERRALRSTARHCCPRSALLRSGRGPGGPQSCRLCRHCALLGSRSAGRPHPTNLGLLGARRRTGKGQPAAHEGAPRSHTGEVELGASGRLVAPGGAGGSAATAPTGAGLFSNTAGLQKLSDIIQVGWACDQARTARFRVGVGVVLLPHAPSEGSGVGQGAHPACFLSAAAGLVLGVGAASRPRLFLNLFLFQARHL